MKFLFNIIRDGGRAECAQQQPCMFVHLNMGFCSSAHRSIISFTAAYRGGGVTVVIVELWCSRALLVNRLFGLHGCRMEVRTYWG